MKVKPAKVERKIFTLSEFRGVDYASSPLEVKPYRATDMANLLLKDGVLHKRNGWEQIVKLPSSAVARDIFLHKDWFVVYATNTPRVYVINSETFEIDNEVTVFFDLVPSHMQAFEYNDVLYLTGNAFLAVGISGFETDVYAIDKSEFHVIDIEFEEKNVPYIPTTTINITGLWEDEEVVSAYPRTKHESLNMLSPFRKNRVIYNDYWSVYELDGNPYQLSTDMFKKTSNPTSSIFTYSPLLIVRTKDGERKKKYNFRPAAKRDEDGYIIGTYWRCEIDLDNGFTADILMGQYGTLYELLLDEGVIDEEVEENKNKWGGKQYKGILFIPSGALLLGEGQTVDWVNDVIVEIVYVDKEEMGDTDATLDKVKKEALFKSHQFETGIIYGVNGANDRLFLAGGGEYANVVFYSENENFLYFPVNQQIVCGDSSEPITAFEKLPDGRLAVFKKVSSLSQASVYYIDGQTVSKGVGPEGNEYFEDRFSVSSGTIAETGISARSTVHYDGDSLFASNDGVYAIVLTNNVYTTERYAKERSRPISSQLKAHDLSDAAAVVYDDRYWLAVADGSGEVFVADSRYKSSTEGTQTNSYNYEWFRLTDIPAVSFLEKDGKLYFISPDGWLCRFHDGYTDIYNILPNSGELTVTTLANDSMRVVVFDDDLLDIIQSAAYAEDENGLRWEILNIREEEIEGVAVRVFDLPAYATCEDGAFGLKIHVPVKAYWKSAVLDLGSPIHKKNLWGVSLSVMPTSNGSVNLGYKTRRENQLEGINAFHFGDVDFSSFSFDCGGFINTFRQRTFERGLTYMQMMYSSESAGDCVVNSITVEYAITNKNIGIG